MTSAVAIFPGMDNLRDQQLGWLENIVASSGLTLTDVARRAGLDPSTLTRFRARNSGGHVLTSRTIKKIEQATGIPAYEQRTRPHISAFMEEEASPYSADEKSENIVVAALQAASKQLPSLDLWLLKTSSLAAAGYQPGDVVAVDKSAEPRVGDAVCAQKYDYRRGTAETIFRIYRTPYLLTAFAAGTPGAPEIVDNENIMIRGVVVGGCHLRA